MADRIAKIYLVTNLINNKKYIGFTTQTVEKRFIQHKYDSMTARRNNSINKAYRKYGITNFSVEWIYSSKDVDHCLRVIEPYFIELYNTYKSGYNDTIGGEGAWGLKASDETRQKQRLRMLGTKASPLSGLKKHLKLRGENHYRTKFTEADITNIKAIYKYCDISQYKLADIYKTNRATIGAICRGKTWCHVSPELNVTFKNKEGI